MAANQARALGIVALVCIAVALGYVFWPHERAVHRVPAPTISTPPPATEQPRQPPAGASILPPAPVPPPGQPPGPAGVDATGAARPSSPKSEPAIVAPSAGRAAVAPGAPVAPRGPDPVAAPATPPVVTAPIETPPAAPAVATAPAEIVPPPATTTPDAIAEVAAPAPAARTVAPDPNGGVSPARRFDAESASLASIVRSYERAYDRLDAAAAAALWPSVDERALARAFARLQTQDLEFDNCTFAVSDNEATAQCAGQLQYSRRIGDPSLKSERHVWTIEFVRMGESWRIVRITAR